MLSDTALTTTELELDSALIVLTPPTANPACVYLASLAEGSRRTMRASLDAMARYGSRDLADHTTFPWSLLAPQHTTALRGWLEGTYAPATARRALAALRGTLRESWRLGDIDSERHARLVDLKPISGTSLPKGRALSSGELGALLGACSADPRPAGARDAALFALLYSGGFRRAEAMGLDLVDYDREHRELGVRFGKGKRSRLVPVAAGAAAALEDWLAVRGDAPGPIFVPIDKSGRLTVRRMRAAAVEEILKVRIAQAGIARAAAHDFRRTMIGDLLDAGADLSTIQRIAGHASSATTARYDRRGDAATRKAAGLLHVPYTPRSSAS